MTQPTLAQAQDALRRVAACNYDCVANYNREAARQYTTFADVYDPSGGQNAALTNILSNLASLQTFLSNMLNTGLTQFDPTTDNSSNVLATQIAALVTYMRDNSARVVSRGVAWGTPAAAGGNVGNQVLRTTSVDYQNLVLEAVTIETISFVCRASAPTGSTLGQEVYDVVGSGRGNLSFFDGVGRGIPSGQTLQALEPGTTSSQLRNTSFDTPFNGTGVSKIPNWTITAGDSVIARTTSIYARERAGVTNASLAITGDCAFYQSFRTQGIQLQTATPYVAAFRVRSATNATGGDVIVRIGTSTGTYTVTILEAALTTSWQTVVIDTNQDDAWAAKFNTDGDPIFQIEVDNYTSGTVYIDDVLFAPMTAFGGRPFAIVSGLTAAVGPNGSNPGDTLTQTTTLDPGVGTVALTAGGSGSVDTITVTDPSFGAVNILPAAVAYNTSLTQTAADVVTAINNARTFPQYSATNTSTVVSISPVVPSDNTITVAATATTITVSDTDITGGTQGLIQDMMVRVTGTALPHNSSAAGGFDDPTV